MSAGRSGAAAVFVFLKQADDLRPPLLKPGFASPHRLPVGKLERIRKRVGSDAGFGVVDRDAFDVSVKRIVDLPLARPQQKTTAEAAARILRQLVDFMVRILSMKVQ